MNGTRHESRDNLRLALAVRPHLQRQGFKVVMSRDTDIFIELRDRTNRANSINADLFVSLHRNAFTNPAANGTENWVFTTPTSAELGLAGDILEKLASVGIQSNRGVKRGNFHVLRESNMPAVMVELGFISNARDNELFDTRFDEYAEAIAHGICQTFGLPYIPEGAVTPEPNVQWYRVQVGAFSVRANAERFLENVRGMGLDAFLVTPDASRGD